MNVNVWGQAQYYMDWGTGRRVDMDEALEILDRCEDAGLVTMPFNTRTPANICNCCSDCCVVLGVLKKHPRPVEMIKPGFHALVDRERYEACEHVPCALSHGCYCHRCDGYGGN